MAHLPHGLPGANVPGVPLVCPRAQARPRDKAVACEPEGTGGPSLPPSGCPCPHPSLAPHSALAWSPRGGRHCGVRSGHSRSSFAWRSPHPLPASPTPASHSVCQGPLLLAPGPTSTGEACQLLRCTPWPPTSWQFVVVCRILLSCKSKSQPRCHALRRRWGVSAFFYSSLAFVPAIVSTA